MPWEALIVAGQAWLEQASLIFILVLTRISAALLSFPLLGGPTIPLRVRALLAVVLTVLLMPLGWPEKAVPVATLLDVTLLAAGNALIGATIGSALALVFAGVQITGQLIGQISGTSIADVFNPALEESTPVYSMLLYLLATTIFLLIGGHVFLFQGLVHTLRLMPPDDPRVFASYAAAAETLVAAAGQGFVLGIRAAAPAVVALFMSTLIMGLIGRTMPQFNVFAVGFGLNALVTLGILSLTLGASAWVFQEELISLMKAVLGAIQPPAG